MRATSHRERVSADTEFPDRPIPAVGAVVFRKGMVLLVKRRADPNRGRWSLPGGSLEVGESVETAVVRETKEETAVRVRPVRVLDVGDFIVTDLNRVRWHYVLIDILCEYHEGEPGRRPTLRTRGSFRFATWKTTTSRTRRGTSSALRARPVNPASRDLPADDAARCGLRLAGRAARRS